MEGCMEGNSHCCGGKVWQMTAKRRLFTCWISFSGGKAKIKKSQSCRKFKSNYNSVPFLFLYNLVCHQRHCFRLITIDFRGLSPPSPTQSSPMSQWRIKIFVLGGGYDFIKQLPTRGGSAPSPHKFTQIVITY